jgi:hypothetical protein
MLETACTTTFGHVRCPSSSTALVVRWFASSATYGWTLLRSSNGLQIPRFRRWFSSVAQPCCAVESTIALYARPRVCPAVVEMPTWTHWSSLPTEHVIAPLQTLFCDANWMVSTTRGRC